MSTLDLDVFLRKRTPEELNSVIKDILTNRVFLSSQIDESSMRLLTQIFMPLAFASFDEEQGNRLRTELGVLYGPYSSSFPRTINGFPILKEVSALNKEDWQKVCKVLEREVRKDFTEELK